MLETGTTSYSLALIPSDHSRPPPHNAPVKPSIKYLITEPLTPHMAFSIALVAWSYVQNLAQGTTMKARDAEDLERTFSSLETTTCLDGTDPC